LLGFEGDAGFIVTMLLVFGGIPGLLMVAHAEGLKRAVSGEARMQEVRPPQSAKWLSNIGIIGTGLLLFLTGCYAWYSIQGAFPVSRAPIGLGGVIFVDIGLPGLVLIGFGVHRLMKRISHARFKHWGAPFSPDGRRRASAATDGPVLVWDAARGGKLSNSRVTLRVLRVWRSAPTDIKLPPVVPIAR
jgi:hypothetical protein